jgi:hypothetical protein
VDRLKSSLPTCPPGSTTTGHSDCWVPHETTRGPEQARIVAILDKFDTLTNSIDEGLPREIELRQKQFEHYREQLLSFPRPADSEG